MTATDRVARRHHPGPRPTSTGRPDDAAVDPATADAPRQGGADVDAADVATPVEAGSLEVAVSVMVTYRAR